MIASNLFVASLLSVGIILAEGAGQCDRSEGQYGALLHFLSWSDHWLDTKYFADADIVLYVAESPSKYVWLVAAKNSIEQEVIRESSFNMLFWKLKDPPGATMNRASCQATDIDGWRSCMERSLATATGTFSFADLLSGNRPSDYKVTTYPLSEDEVIHCTIPSSSVANWRASPVGPMKQRLFSQIREEILEEAQAWPKFRYALCNDYNIDDPEVFALVFTEGLNGPEATALLRIGLQSDAEPAAHTTRIEYRIDSSELAAKVLKSSTLRVAPP